jgi:hypothetical protein
MAPIKRLPATLAFLSLLPIGFTAYASPAGEQVGTFVADGVSHPVDDLTQSCPPPHPTACAYGDSILRESCSVGKVKELGRFGQSQHLLIRYSRSRTIEGGEGNEDYPCDTDEIVLAALDGQGRARIVWRDAVEREFVFVSSTKLYSTAESKSVLSVLYCLNGTGGCDQGMLIWTGSAWQTLERDDSWQAVYRSLPDGYRQHKSPQIDPGNLTWEQHLAHESDANCCPSGRIDFDLAINDNKLEVKSYEIVVPKPQNPVESLAAKQVSELDPRLPPGPFRPWLESVLPAGVVLSFEVNDCGEQNGNPRLDRQGDLPVCIGVEAAVVSRNRNLELLFDEQSLTFRSGSIFSAELEGPLVVSTLSDLPALLKKGMRPWPLQCPPHTTLRLKEEHAGLYEWCEDARGSKHGPYRSWFSTGLYLMEKGEYDHGSKAGGWIECSRFESCALNAYTGDSAP